MKEENEKKQKICQANREKMDLQKFQTDKLKSEKEELFEQCQVI